MKENLGRIWKVPNQAPNLFAMVYAPELDASPVFDTSLEPYYDSQIGVLRWMVEIVQVDINTEVLMLNSCLSLQCEGHIEVVLHIYGYLCVKPNTRLALDPSYPNINERQFLQ